MYLLQHNLKKIVLVFLIPLQTIYSFDVKVLLNRYKLENSIQETELFCPGGFVVSSHPQLALGIYFDTKKLKISYADDVIKVNDKVLKEKNIYIFPKISHTIELQLKSQLSYWFESFHVQIDKTLEKIDPVFKKMLEDKQPLSDASCQEIMMIAQKISHVYLDHLIKDHLELQKYESLLLSYIQEFLNLELIKSFKEVLENKHLRPELRKILLKNIQKRHQFFNQELSKLLEDLLYKFLCALPRKIIATMIHDSISMIEYEGNKYLGSFVLCSDKKQLLLINTIDINDYLLSVVRYEGFPGWPVEMNKVIAITCRTYLVYQVLQSQKIDRLYHIENKNTHQTYKGHHHCPKIKQAIEETEDIILGYQGKPACTMYDICCGGVIPAFIEDPEMQKIPYLSRKYPCNFCKSYKVYKWSLNFSIQELIDRIHKEYGSIEKITDFHIYKKDKAGLVRKIIINSGKQKIIITEKKMRQLFPEMKSYIFDIKKHHKKYHIEGKGFGHHRGMCQWGAYHLVKHEYWNFSQVLDFYYPGTSLMKLNY